MCWTLCFGLLDPGRSVCVGPCVFGLLDPGRSVCVGLCVFGLLVYWIPVSQSVLVSVLCVCVCVCVCWSIGCR